MSPFKTHFISFSAIRTFIKVGTDARRLEMILVHVPLTNNFLIETTTPDAGVIVEKGNSDILTLIITLDGGA